MFHVKQFDKGIAAKFEFLVLENLWKTLTEVWGSVSLMGICDIINCIL
jgi:hypothetical protein